MDCRNALFRSMSLIVSPKRNQWRFCFPLRFDWRTRPLPSTAVRPPVLSWSTSSAAIPTLPAINFLTLSTARIAPTAASAAGPAAELVFALFHCFVLCDLGLVHGRGKRRIVWLHVKGLAIRFFRLQERSFRLVLEDWLSQHPHGMRLLRPFRIGL